MNWMYIAAFLTGIFASMGVGGGMILIVYLTVFAGFSQVSAQGINLVYFIPIALLALIIHTRNKLVEWKRIIPSLITGLIFSAAGAFAANAVSSDLLGKIYGAFILLIGIKELLYKEKTHPKELTTE